MNCFEKWWTKKYLSPHSCPYAHIPAFKNWHSFSPPLLVKVDQQKHSGWWATADGQWSTGNGQGVTVDGQRSTGNGRRATAGGQWPAGNGRRATADGQRPTGNGRRATANGQRPRGNDQRATADGQWRQTKAKQQHDNFFWEKKKQPEKNQQHWNRFKKKSSPHCSISKKKICTKDNQKKIASLSHLHTPVPMFHACILMLPFPRSRPKFLIFTLKKTSTHRNGQEQWAMATVNGDGWIATGQGWQVNGDGQWWRYGNGWLAAATW